MYNAPRDFISLVICFFFIKNSNEQSIINKLNINIVIQPPRFRTKCWSVSILQTYCLQLMEFLCCGPWAWKITTKHDRKMFIKTKANTRELQNIEINPR